MEVLMQLHFLLMDICMELPKNYDSKINVFSSGSFWASNIIFLVASETVGWKIFSCSYMKMFHPFTSKSGNYCGHRDYRTLPV